MGFAEIIAAFIAAALITAIFSYGFKIKGPWGKGWMFFIILFLGIWLMNLWIGDVGPTWWGLSLLPALGIGLLFAFILASTSPSGRKYGGKRVIINPDTPQGGTVVALTALIWVILLTFLVAIGLGYLSMLF